MTNEIFYDTPLANTTGLLPLWKTPLSRLPVQAIPGTQNRPVEVNAMAAISM
jgi:hypothetical protein